MRRGSAAKLKDLGIALFLSTRSTLLMRPDQVIFSDAPDQTRAAEESSSNLESDDSLETADDLRMTDLVSDLEDSSSNENASSNESSSVDEDSSSTTTTIFKNPRTSSTSTKYFHRPTSLVMMKWVISPAVPTIISGH